MRRALRLVAQGLPSRLLIAAMLSPIAAKWLGWRLHTPLDVPLAVHVTVLAIIGGVAYRQAGCDRPWRGGSWVLSWFSVPVLGLAFAVFLHERANVFYTGRALMDGMAVVLLVHLGRQVLRRRALPRPKLILHKGAASVAVAPLSGQDCEVWLERTPSTRLADRLARVVGWSLLASWVLSAFTYRHVVAPLLLAAGLLEVVAFLLLVPDAMVRLRLAGEVRRANRSARALTVTTTSV